MKKNKNPELSALMSLILPGLGQIYCFRIIWAIVWFIFTAGLWVGVTPLGFIAHLLSAWQAYGMAKKRNR